MGYRNISFSDIEKHKLFTMEEDYKNKHLIRNIVHDLGIDLRKGFDVLYSRHRSNISNQVFVGKYYQGVERKDEVWLDMMYKVNSLEVHGHYDGNLLDAYDGMTIEELEIANNKEFDKALKDIKGTLSGKTN